MVGSMVGGLVFGLIALFGATFLIPSTTLGTVGGDLADACTSMTVTQVPIGNQVSTAILATSSRRAYVLLEEPVNATNTISISTNFGAPAVLNGGMSLTPATSTSPVPLIELGLNTELPYTGGITAITGSGSTTISITNCNY